MPITVALGGIEFNTGTVDANGATWRAASVEGWESPDIEQAILNPTGSHGQILAEGLYRARPMVLAGYCRTPSVSAMWLSKARLAAAIDVSVPSVLRVDETTPKRANVIRGGSYRTRDVGTRGFHLEVPLLALDSRKFAETASIIALGASTSAPNAGTFETYPYVLTVVGATTDPMTFATGGKTVRFNVALTGAETLVSDLGRRTVTINGVDRFDVVDSSTRWWALAPGANTVTTGGGGTKTLEYRSAWI